MDLAGSWFLRLVRVLWTVVLQDSAFIPLPLFPNNPVWKADVLSSRAYQPFAARVTATSKAAEEPEDLQIKTLLPVLYDRMSMMQADFRQSHAALQQGSDLQWEVRVLSADPDLRDGPPGLRLW
jgi:hypothetical protein